MPETSFLTRAQAPANIAIAKYMGKENSALNLAATPSLSLTLSSLQAHCEVRWYAGTETEDSWEPHSDLNENERIRALRHVAQVRKALPSILSVYGLPMREPGALCLRTANTFPLGVGIASSASSFAAITLATSAALCADPVKMEEIFCEDQSFRKALAQISRLGSGSSCRSFDGPWVLWEGEAVSKIGAALPEMADLVLLISDVKKETPSSLAHEKVRTSPLWYQRVERARARVRLLEKYLADGDLTAIAASAWEEAWEMHSLFHTSSPPFTFWEPGTIETLKWFSGFITQPSPPIVTLDAGPNVHVIVPVRDAVTWRKRLSDRFPKLKILEDVQGGGARLLPLI